MKPTGIRATALLLMMMAATAQALAGTAPPVEQLPELSVRGEAILQVPADQMRLIIGVVSHGSTAETTLARNSETMQQVKNSLQKAGLSDDEYSTGSFQVQPTWEPRPRNAPWDWKPAIAGYTVSNALKIVTRRLELAGTIIEAAAAAGANDIHSLSFDLAEPRRHRAAAIEQATANALNDAATLALAARVRLIRVVSVRLDDAVATPMRVAMRGMAMEAGITAETPPIEAGDVTVRAGVHMVYEIGR